jgi:polysaccharide biosynthesis/export protein
MYSQASRLSSWVLLAAWLSSGCSGGSNGRSGLFGLAHPLIPEARALKASYPDPLAVPRELDKSVMGPYLVEPGDVLLVLPARQDATVSLPADQPVLPDGRIQLGPFGFLQVAGQPLEQIEASINAQVSAQAKDSPRLTVRLATAESKVYYVLGEVNAPNAYPFRGRETVLDAVVRAGGLTGSASRRDILLSRPTPPPSCRLVLPVCWNEIVQLADTTTNYHLRPGDRIYVPTRGFCESLCPTKPGCPPCGRGQTPCPIPPTGACPAAGPTPPAPPGDPAPAETLPAPSAAPPSTPKAPGSELSQPPSAGHAGEAGGRGAGAR